jgi:hypothetical protein
MSRNEIGSAALAAPVIRTVAMAAIAIRDMFPLLVISLSPLFAGRG